MALLDLWVASAEMIWIEIHESILTDKVVESPSNRHEWPDMDPCGRRNGKSSPKVLCGNCDTLACEALFKCLQPLIAVLSSCQFVAEPLERSAKPQSMARPKSLVWPKDVPFRKTPEFALLLLFESEEFMSDHGPNFAFVQGCAFHLYQFDNLINPVVDDLSAFVVHLPVSCFIVRAILRCDRSRVSK